MTERILITGAAGGVGTLMRPRLAAPDRVLRLLDIGEQPAASEGERVELLTASVTDQAAMDAACSGVDAVIHLGGHSLEQPWKDILAVNIDGTHTVLEAARRNGVKRVVLASSNHAAGFHRRGAQDTPDYAFPRPDTYYGVSKVAVEALGALYADRYGLDVIAIRIGSCFEKPRDVRMLSTWLSPGDCARMLEACLSTPSPGFRVIWGVSDNTRRWVSLDEAKALGYQSEDNSEQFAEEIIAEQGMPAADGPELNYVGGVWVTSAWDTAVKEAAK